MSYVLENLSPGERLVYRAHLHWIIFAWPLFWLALGLFGLANSLRVGTMAEVYLSMALLLFGAWRVAAAYIRLFTTEIALTSKRLIAKVGFIRRQSVELKLQQLETIGIDQGVTGRLLGYGTVRPAGTGGKVLPIPDIAAPLAFRNWVTARIDQLPASKPL